MNENKKDREKILLVLQSALHIRNFIASGLVKKMADNADVTVVIPQKFALTIKGFLKESVRITHIEEFKPNRYRKWWLGIWFITLDSQKFIWG